MYYLHGGAGAPSFGDELIARQWLDFLGENNVKNVILSGYRRHVMDRLYAKRYPDVVFTDSLYKHQSECEEDFWKSFSKGYHFLDGKQKRPQSVDMERLQNTRVFHLYGGGYINTLWPKHAFYLGLAASIRRNVNCRIIGTGLGLMPMSPPPRSMELKLAEALESFDVLEVRDVESYHYANSWSDSENITHGLDDAFLAAIKTNAPRKRGRFVRTLHLSLHADKNGKSILDSLSEDFVNSFERRLFWISHYKDAEQFKNVVEKFPSFSKISLEDLAFGPMPVGPDDFLIATHFHPHLMAARAGARGQYFSSGTYSRTNHQSAIDAGSGFAQTSEAPTTAKPSSRMIKLEESRAKKKKSLWLKATKGTFK